MRPDTGAISLLTLAAALSIGALVIGVLFVSERAPSHATSPAAHYLSKATHHAITSDV